MVYGDSDVMIPRYLLLLLFCVEYISESFFKEKVFNVTFMKKKVSFNFGTFLAHCYS